MNEPLQNVAQRPRDPRDFIFNVDFVRYLEILGQQKSFILSFCLSAVLTSLALTYATSERYQAAATIYYRPVDSTLLRSRNVEAFGAPVPSPAFKVISQTLNDVVKSEAIVRPVVEELGLHKEVKPRYDAWYKEWFQESKKAIKGYALDAWEVLKYGRVIEESPMTRAVIGLGESIKIDSTKDSYIFILSVKDQYPERAAKIIDAVALQLVRWSKQQDVSPAQSRGRRLAAELEEKERLRTTLRQERDGILRSNGIASVAEEVNTGVQSLYTLKVELERLAAQTQEKRQRISEIGEMLRARPARYLDPDHARRLEEERLLAEIEVKSLGARRDSVNASIGRMQERLQFILSVKKRIEDIDAKIEVATRETQHMSDMQLESTEGQARESEVKLMTPAMVPEKPVQPIKIYHVGLTAALSLVLSVGLIYVFAYFNIRVFFASRRPTPRGGANEGTEVARV